ncbi:MAG: response regulator [Gammaproteobacteria bacterium]|nr:response regulator [Gammaproteobacteria bacterium]
MGFFTSISRRLLAGFLLLSILTAGLGLHSISALTELGSLTQKMYDHPFTVSNAVRHFKTDIIEVDRLLQKVLLNETLDKHHVSKTIQKIRLFEVALQENLSTIDKQFLGGREQVQVVRVSFDYWLESVEKIKLQIKNGHLLAARETYQKELTAIQAEFFPKVDALLDYAMNKAVTFLENSKVTVTEAVNQTLWLLVVILMLGAFAGWVISNSIRRPINGLVSAFNELILGANDVTINDTDRIDEIGDIARALQALKESTDKLIVKASNIAQGDYSTQVEMRSNKDELGLALKAMSNSLQEGAKKNSDYAWVMDGQNQLNETVRGELTPLDLSKLIITFVCQYVDAQVGSLYLLEEDTLILKGSYAFVNRKGDVGRFKLGEGLVGQCGLEKTTISITDVPEEYSLIVSATGNARPRNILLTPLSYDGKLIGVMELGRLGVFSEEEKAFINLLSENVAIAFNSAQARQKVDTLLAESQAQSEELLLQKEELTVTNEQILEKSKELEQQAIALEASNVEALRKAKEIEEASKYKSEFMSNMSHELRTPLNSLLILAKSLVDNDEGNLSKEDVESAKIIHDSGKNLLELINQILDLSKVESGHMQAAEDHIEMRDFIDSMNARFKHMAKDKNIDFNIELAPDAPAQFIADWTKLNQVVTNLVSNALKFTASGGVLLKIFTTPAKHTEQGFDRMISFSVQDSGIGIAEDKFETVFEAFKQADGSTTRNYGGTGLGLSIARNFAQLMGGGITLKSRLGEGSVFTLHIPEVRSNEVSETALSAPAIGKVNALVLAQTAPPFTDDRAVLDQQSPLILIIEDDTNFAHILYEACHQVDCQALVAADGETGVSLANEYEVTAIILDYMLPGLDGKDVLGLLKSNTQTSHIPVHVMSAMDSLGDMTLLGAEAQFEKPISAHEIKAVLQGIKQDLNSEDIPVLIVEDNLASRKAMEKLLRHESVVLSFADSVSAALKALRASAYDVMILDLGLPDYSGFELLELIEKEPTIMLPKVIVYSGKDLSTEDQIRLSPYTQDIIIKSSKSSERLLDEVHLFINQLKTTSHSPKKVTAAKLPDIDTNIELKGKTILVVDDDMRNTFALSKVLRKSGLKVILSPGGADALAKLASQQSVDLVLMDIMMPDMDGFEATRRIRAQSQYQSIPILALTANAMKGDREKCLEAGMNDYLSKPIDTDKLFTMIKMWLSAH